MSNNDPEQDIVFQLSNAMFSTFSKAEATTRCVPDTHRRPDDLDMRRSKG